LTHEQYLQLSEIVIDGQRKTVWMAAQDAEDILDRKRGI
jgi:uncharacterized protein YabE (DUF348 family)